MSTLDQDAGAPPTVRTRLDWRNVADRTLGWTALVALAVGVAVTLTGERPATLDDLRAGLASGEVHEVTIHGHRLAPGSTGFRTVTVTWKDTPLDRFVEVVDATSPAEARSAGWSWGSRRVVVDLTADLRELAPDLEVVDRPASHSSMSGWGGVRVPAWTGWVSTLLVGVVLVQVVLGPAPWRATRWAWAWLVLASPLGAAAYLVLGGPTGLVGTPRDGTKRWRGGPGFVVAILLGALLSWRA